jgi:hypothetical protein
MIPLRRHGRLSLVLVLLIVGWALVIVRVGAGEDEGMWTFDNPPVRLLKERYNFDVTRQWLDHLRLSSVRFNDGGSGSFISPTGLVLTNHHVARGQLQKISSAKKDYAADGFLARTRAEELKATDLELNVLVSMEEVTSRVQAATAKAPDEKAALELRRAEIARIEKESLDKTGLRSDVVPLYGGGEYWLYRYKVYTDVRLVFAPEQQIAFFGGDPDNFTYPRYDLDMAVFRVYENGKPIQSPNYLKWNPRGAADGELVFVSGHPGTTSRLDTVAQLQTLGSQQLPLYLEIFKNRVATLRRYGEGGSEQARQAADLIFGLENSIKAYAGELGGLRNPSTLNKKEKEDADQRAALATRPALEKYADAWGAIDKAEQAYRQRLSRFIYTSPNLSFARSVTLALTLVRYATETRKPDGERLPGYHEAQLPSLRLRLFSSAPFYPAMDEALVADWLKEASAALGPGDPFVKAALAGETPETRAKSIVAGSTIQDVAFRKQLADGGEAAVTASTDPLITFARTIDPFGREVRKWYEDAVESVEVAASERIARARFDLYGKSVYPDATFTLRLAFGTVRGYPMNGTKAPSHTTFYGLYDRAYGFDIKPPFNLPRRYVDRRAALDLKTPFNFVNTCDIVGGNSGSPVVNRNGELVGLIFDGNIESLVGSYVYDEETNRAVAVHAGAMIEALRKLYDAGALADEIEGKAARTSPRARTNAPARRPIG